MKNIKIVVAFVYWMIMGMVLSRKNQVSYEKYQVMVRQANVISMIYSIIAGGYSIAIYHFSSFSVIQRGIVPNIHYLGLNVSSNDASQIDD